MSVLAGLLLILVTPVVVTQLSTSGIPKLLSVVSGLLIVFLLAVFLTGSAAAQNATGAINGTVKDQNDALIPNAVVTATNKTTGASRTLNTRAKAPLSLKICFPANMN